MQKQVFFREISKLAKVLDFLRYSLMHYLIYFLEKISYRKSYIPVLKIKSIITLRHHSSKNYGGVYNTKTASRFASLYGTL